MSLTHAEESQELATKLEFAAVMEAAFADIVGTPAPKEKGEATVAWYLKALQRLDKQKAEVDSYYLVMAKQCVEWATARGVVINTRRRWLDETYLATVEAVTRAKTAHSGKKSFDFCYGVGSFRKQQDKLDVTDEPAVLNWCELNLPAAIRTKVARSVDRAALKAHMAKTGEEIPGTTLTPGIEQFYVKPAPLALPGEPKLLGANNSN